MMQTTRRRLLAASAAALACPALAQEKEPQRTGGPYVPTPQIVVDAMLRMANVGPNDHVIDLGSGDGVIVLTAASRMKASGVGVDIDPVLVRRSNAEAKRLGVDARASFRVEDVFKTDLSRASVITLYLLPAMMLDLRGKIYLEAQPGTRVVSHDYHFESWEPDEEIAIEVPEKEKINGAPRALIMLWIVPAKVEGRWRVEIEGGEGYDVTLRQRYQNLSAMAAAAGKPVNVTYTSLRGDEIHFALFDGRVRRNFSGTAGAATMHGTVDLGGGRAAAWRARRV